MCLCVLSFSDRDVICFNFEVMDVQMLAIECHLPCRIPLKHVDNVTPALAFNSFHARDNFCRLLITFVNSLYPEIRY